jgi:hypothetical protein
MRRVYRLDMTKIFFCMVVSVVVSGCAIPEEPVPMDIGTSEAELGHRICTPGTESCDWGCYYVGGPSTDDCIVRCNASGTGYVVVENCGYAQNFPYSSSCLEIQPHPVCEWN